MNGSHALDFHSDDAAEIRAWVKTRTGIDIDLPAAQSTIAGGPVRLLGARVIRFHGEPLAAIDYRTGDDVGTLVVSSGRSTAASNTGSSGHRLLSWNMRNQTYTIAFPGARDARRACLLCHANAPAVLMSMH
jgi:anti-sigma factor RsiW